MNELNPVELNEVSGALMINFGFGQLYILDDESGKSGWYWGFA